MSLSGSVALTLPVTTPVVAFAVTVGVPATGAEFDGAIVGVTVTVAEPPCPSEMVTVKESVFAVAEERAEVRAAAVGV